jgi:IclR family acetate operon transcriptional repressor
MEFVREPTETGDEKYSLRSVNRAIDVLEALGDDKNGGMGVGEIAEAIGVSRSTAFTLLQTLVVRGFVSDVRIGGARLYRLGLSLAHLGDRAFADIGVAQTATPILQQLTEATQLTSRLAVLDDGYAVAIGRIDSPGPFRMTASLGRRELPHCSGVGKALLAGLPDEEIAVLVGRLGMPRRTERTVTTVDALLADLKETRLRGYAFDDEEDNVGVFCVAAAVYGRSSEMVAAISVTGMKLDRSRSDLDNLGKTVRAYADRISLQLGSQPTMRPRR